MRHITAIVFVLWLGVTTGFSQSGVPSTMGPFSLGLQAGISYSGWNLALVGSYQYESVSGYLGPSISLNRGLPGTGPIGMTAGVNYHIPSQKSWLSSLVNLDYQLNLFHAGSGSTDAIHELHVSYGLVFHVTEAFYIVQQLGYGMYFESVLQETTGTRRTFNGYDGLVRLRAGYFF
ncbi:MAG: hypothetical protein AAF570_24575 [Bacteroidota bacterium]